MPTAPREAEQNAQVLAMQMDALFKAAPASVLGICGGAMALYAFWSPETANGLIFWMVFIVGVASVHIAGAFGRAKGLPSSWTDLQWSRLARGIYLSAGLTWGVGGGWMVTQGNDHQILVISCIAMAAVTATFPAVVYPVAYNLFQSSLFISLAVGYALSSMEFGALLAAGCVLMALFGAFIGHGMGTQLAEGMKLSIDNRQMARRLEERGMALEAANRDLEIQTLTDPLTGVANRRRLMAFARSTQGPCALLVVDIDHFKAYNDAFGHVEGDACLVAVAETLTRTIRPSQDLVARLGGEEFAVVLTDLDETRAMAIAESLRANIELLPRSRPSSVRRLVTVSIGFAYRGPDQYKSLAQLMEEADAAVYRAKSTGRNQVVHGDKAKNRAA